MYYSPSASHFNQRFKYILIVTIALHAAVIFYKMGGTELILSTGESSQSLSVRVLLQQALKQPKPAVQKKQIKKKKIIKTKAPTKKVAAPVEQTQQEPTQEQKISQNPEKAFESFIKDFVQPSYPRLALRRGITGLVIISLYIKSDGSIEKVLVAQSSGNDLLDNSALRAAKQWKFKALNAATNKLTFVQKRIVYKIN